MPITKETLDAKLTELSRAKQQAIANLNAIEGAEVIVRQLLETLDTPAAPEPATDAPVGS